jgi:hypothetical protein
MGVFGHNDVFSRKHITAVIRDSHDRGFFVHLTKSLDEFFVTKLNKTFYAFSMEDARIITHKEFAIRSFRWVDFDTSHYKCIQFDKLEELKLLLIKNKLGRMNRLQFAFLQRLGRKERKKELKDLQFAKAAIDKQILEKGITDTEKLTVADVKDIDVPPHDVQALIDELVKEQTDFPEQHANLITYIKSLDIDTIVTPCRKISEYIEDDLITTKASFLGEIIPRLMRILGKHGEIMNTPYSSKNAWFNKLVFMSIIVMGVAMIAWMADAGYFNEITRMFPDTSSFQGVGDAFTPKGTAASVNACSDDALQAKYTPEALKIAIDSGAETCKIPPATQELVDGVQVVQAAPTGDQ